MREFLNWLSIEKKDGGSSLLSAVIVMALVVIAGITSASILFLFLQYASAHGFLSEIAIIAVAALVLVVVHEWRNRND